jgi:hypothetical protein
MIGDEPVEKKPMRADELLPILKKTGAWGFGRFNELVNF